MARRTIAAVSGVRSLTLMTQRIAEVLTSVLGTSTKLLLNTQYLVVLCQSLTSTWSSSLNLYNNRLKISANSESFKILLKMQCGLEKPDPCYAHK